MFEWAVASLPVYEWTTDPGWNRWLLARGAPTPNSKGELGIAYYSRRDLPSSGTRNCPLLRPHCHPAVVNLAASAPIPRQKIPLPAETPTTEQKCGWGANAQQVTRD